MRPVVQIVRFYLINKYTGSRSIESLMDNPKYSALLQHCVNTVMRYPDWAIDECERYKEEIDNKKFKFDTGTWAMDIREEDLPKGTEVDSFEIRNAFSAIIAWIHKNREIFTKRLIEHERRRYEC